MEKQPTHAEIAVVLKRVENKVEELTEVVNQMREMVETWNAVKTGGRAITWLAKVAAGILALIVLAKAGMVWMVEMGGKP